jgi:hypothetical protein
VKPTPGPWEVRSAFVGPLQVWAGDHIQVADVGADTFDVCDANARLIAAAPDLLDALVEAKTLIDGSYGTDKTNPNIWPEIRPLQRRIDSAIKKAKGEQ